MYKRIVIFLMIVMFLCMMASGCSGSTKADTEQADSTAAEAAKPLYNDGDYEGLSKMTDEGFYGKARITVKNGLISDVDFKMYDKMCFKAFLPADKVKGVEEMLLDETYSKEVYAGQKLYQDQCTNEFNGVKQYKSKLISGQDIKSVDVITGATWSHSLFKEAVEDAISKASKK